MEVVRRDGFKSRRLRDVSQHMVQLGLGVARVRAQTLVLQLDVEVAGVETAGEFARPFDGIVELPVIEQLGDDACDARRRADDAMPVLLQHRERGARFVIEVVDMRFADQLEQVVIPLVGLRQQKQVVELRLHVLAKVLVNGEVHLAAVNGLDPLARLRLDRVASVAKLGHARHDAVVGDGDCGHAEIGRAAHHVLHVSRSVEQRIFGMVMQVDERHGSLASPVTERRIISRVPYRTNVCYFLDRTHNISIARKAAANKPWIRKESEPAS